MGGLRRSMPELTSCEPQFAASYLWGDWAARRLFFVRFVWVQT